MMEQKPLIAKEADLVGIKEEDARYQIGRNTRYNEQSITLRTGLRASKRSLRNLKDLDSHTPKRTNLSKPLINTKALRYNPAGPGDYNIPSGFGELPPVKAAKQTKSAFYSDRNQSLVLKKNPSFSIQQRLNNNQVIKANLQMFQGVDTPGVGSYDPLKETFEDKRKKKVMRRLNMYNQVSKVNRSQHARNSLLNSEPASAQQNRTVQHSELIAGSIQDTGSINTFGVTAKHRHLSPNAASTRIQEEKLLTLEPNQDKLFGTQKRFFKPANQQTGAEIPHQYVQAFSSIVKQTFSTGMYQNKNKTSQTSLQSRNMSMSPSRHLKEKESQQIIGKSGRPIFAKDSDKHMTPAPAYYKPEIFDAYQSRTKFNEQRKSLPKQQRFRETAHIRFASDTEMPIPPRENKQICYPELEKIGDPGPGQYQDNRIDLKKRVLHSIPSTDRNLLVNPDKPNPPIPGPHSYDLVTGLSMCSSTQYLGEISPSLKRQLRSQDSIPEITDNEIQRTANKSLMGYNNNDALKKESSQASIRSKNNSQFRKQSGIKKQKMTLAPKMKMGIFGTAKRSTEFNTEFV